MIEGVYDVVNCQLIRDKGNDEEANFRPEWGIVTGLHDRELIYGHNIVFRRMFHMKIIIGGINQALC